MERCLDVAPEEIVRYLDGELGGGRGELVAAHLKVCPICRQWRDDFAWTTRVIREASPPIDDPAARVALSARLDMLATSRARTLWWWPRLLLAGLGLALLLALGAAFIAPTQAHRSISRFFQFTDWPHSSIPPGGAATPFAAPPTYAPIAVFPCPAQAPQVLPLGLHMVSWAKPMPGRCEWEYHGDGGVIVVLARERAADITYRLPTQQGTSILIAGTEVFVQPDPRPGMVASLKWEQHGIVSTLLAWHRPPDGFPLADARVIVEALIQAP